MIVGICVLFITNHQRSTYLSNIYVFSQWQLAVNCSQFTTDVPKLPTAERVDSRRPSSTAIRRRLRLLAENAVATKPGGCFADAPRR